MILFLLAAAATPAPAFAGDDKAKFAACTTLASSHPEDAVAAAEGWTRANPSVPARQCLGIAYAAAGRWEPAVTAFSQAATAAETNNDGRAANLWAQAGNAALAGDDPAKARGLLDRALATPGLAASQRGETLLDRARADLALEDLGAARIDIDKGRDLSASDPFGWLLSANLARRQKDLDRAEKEIAEAARLDPNDAAIALEAGTIAAASGAIDAARTAWARAVELAPAEPEGKAASAALAANR